MANFKSLEQRRTQDGLWIGSSAPPPPPPVKGKKVKPPLGQTVTIVTLL